MKEIISNGVKLYGKCIVGSIMCFFLVLTLNVLETTFFTKNIGYTVYGTAKGQQEQVELYTHYYDDGEDTKKQEYIDEGYTLSEVTVRSQVAKKTAVLWSVVSEIFLLFMFGVFVYNFLWTLGFKDNNAVRIGIKPENKLKGLQIGLVASVPAFLLLTVFAIGKSSFTKTFSIALYAFFNPHLYEAIISITSGGGYVGDLTFWQILIFYLLILFVPILSQIAYILGYKSVLLSEKIIYKKK